MRTPPEPIRAFLASRRIAVAGVSRDPAQTANVVYRRLREVGAEVFPVNPHAESVEGVACHASVGAIPGGVEAVMVATAPAASLVVARECADLGVKHVWFHRSFGDGSVSAEAVALLRAKGVEPIVGGCPLMYAGRVDPAHGCMRWVLGAMGKLPR